MTEHFFVPKVNVIESSAGFSVEVLGRTGLRYTESEKILEVDSEVLAGTAGIMLLANSIQNWKSPTHSIDTAERSRIIENICRAFAWRGHNVEVYPENWHDA